MRTNTILGVLLGGLLLVACAGDEAGTTSTTTSPATTSTTAPTTTTAPSTTTTTVAATTSTSAPTTTSAPPAPSTTNEQLPGEPIEFGPAEGDTVGVVGVAHNDVLNLRAGPGADQPILHGIPPTYTELVAMGQTRQLRSGALWSLVVYEATDGWVNLRYIAYLGAADDVTTMVIESLGETPSANTMAGLGLIVADAMAGAPSADIVMSVAPTGGDLGEVTYDITGFEDDSVRGSRAHIFGEPTDDGFVLRTIEATPFCARGVDSEGRCV